MTNIDRRLKPIIAILTAQTEDAGRPPYEKVSIGYTQRVYEAGGIPVILPNLLDALEHYLPMMDGLLIIGGRSDVHPSLYGENVNGAKYLNLEKDKFEIQLIEGAIKKGAPIFGICRGMQMLNVYFKGSLKQDISGHFIKERYQEPVHKMHIQGSRILKTGEYDVNSIHHQVVKKVGAGLRATGISCDGHIEMIEHTDLPIFGVQWHPESLEKNETSAQLFAHLIKKSRSRTHQPNSMQAQTDMINQSVGVIA